MDAAPPISEKQLGNWKLLEDFRRILKEVSAQHPRAPHQSWSHPQRQLDQGSYLSLFLLGLFNPVVRTMRAVCEASHLPRVQEEVCRRPVSLGSFSAAQHLLDVELLDQVFGRLSEQVLQRPEQVDRRLAQREWLAQDGSVWPALARMAWAMYGVGPKGTAKGVRLHLTFNLVKDKPQKVRITPGQTSERKIWKEQWRKGEAYVGDRHFSQNYRLLAQLQDKDCVFILRLKDNATIVVEEELELSAQDRAHGVVRQAWGRLGAEEKWRSIRVRIVWIESAKGPVILVTNLSVAEAGADLVGQIYRWRWQIELFFRWVKCILGCRHWLAESPSGTRIQIYLALIAALLFQLYVGKRPSRRMMEMLQFYILRVATLEDLQAALLREMARQSAKKR
jgi:hypothetical protein